jgi:hypothetical protein
MPFGILEDHRTPMPIGTVVLDEVYGAAHIIDPDDPSFTHLKKDGAIVLQPQPSDSPNDPLNWSLRHKYYFSCLLMLTMTTVGATHGMLQTGMRILAEKYHKTFPQVVEQLSPPYVAAHAITLFFASANSAVWGKRVQYVSAIVLVWACMLAGYFANSLEYYAGLRVFEGIAAAPLDLLMAPMITDTIYIHQRGRLMALQAIVHVIGGDARYVYQIMNASCTKEGSENDMLIWRQPHHCWKHHSPAWHQVHLHNQLRCSGASGGAGVSVRLGNDVLWKTARISAHRQQS